MKAVVRYDAEPGAIEVRNVSDPVPGRGEVLLEVHACGVCGSDLEAFHRRITTPVPVIHGHEFSGTIAEVGPEVEDFKPGDRVACETHAYVCGRCEMCRTGNYNICPKRKGFGFGVNGAFAQYVVAPERCLHRVPDNVDLAIAAMTEPLSVAYNALVRKSRIVPGDTVTVIGAGAIGLMAVQVARVSGASEIVLAGLSHDRSRLETGKEIGATQTINVETESLLDAVRERSNGRGADLVVDAAGPPASVKQAMEVVRRNGQITKIAWGPKPFDSTLDPLVAKAVALQGVFSHTWDTWERALRLVSSGQINLDHMITHRVSIENWRTAFTAVEDRSATKAMIVPDGVPA